MSDFRKVVQTTLETPDGTLRLGLTRTPETNHWGTDEDYPVWEVYTLTPNGWWDRSIGTVVETVEGGFLPYDRAGFAGEHGLTLCGAARELAEHESIPSEPTDLFEVVAEFDLEVDLRP